MTAQDTTRQAMEADLFIHKIASEGGVVGALEYGLTDEDCAEPELATLWRAARDGYEAMRDPLFEVIRALIGTIRAPEVKGEPEPAGLPFAQKVRWEGGVMAALDYGLRASDCADPALAAHWQALEMDYASFAPAIAAAEAWIAEYRRRSR